MKQTYAYIGTFLLIFTTSCTVPNYNQDLAHKKVLKKERIFVDNDRGRGKGGNSEVRNINQCFYFTGHQVDKCLNIFYPNDINITIYPSTEKSIKLAGRTSSIERREFNLGGEDRFILHLNTSKVVLPVSCNIRTTKLSQMENSLVIDIPVKDIKNSILLYDKNHRLILDYTIEKN